MNESCLTLSPQEQRILKSIFFRRSPESLSFDKINIECFPLIFLTAGFPFFIVDVNKSKERLRLFFVPFSFVQKILKRFSTPSNQILVFTFSEQWSLMKMAWKHILSSSLPHLFLFIFLFSIFPFLLLCEIVFGLLENFFDDSKLIETISLFLANITTVVDGTQGGLHHLEFDVSSLSSHERLQLLN